jgi:hypothetical protein
MPGNDCEPVQLDLQARPRTVATQVSLHAADQPMLDLGPVPLKTGEGNQWEING